MAVKQQLESLKICICKTLTFCPRCFFPFEPDQCYQHLCYLWCCSKVSHRKGWSAVFKVEVLMYSYVKATVCLLFWIFFFPFFPPCPFPWVLTQHFGASADKGMSKECRVVSSILAFGWQCVLACWFITFVILDHAYCPRIDHRITEKCRLDPLEVICSNTLQLQQWWLQRHCYSGSCSSWVLNI